MTASPTSTPPLHADFDHVAIAAERQADVWPRYVGELGATWMAGGAGPGFAPAQVGFAGGMRLEVLEPHDVEHNDFLRRFLDRSGPGPHHLTFKVADLGAALAGARALDIEPVGVDTSDPEWQEAFLHPRRAFGIVVQLAQSAGGWTSSPPPSLPVSLPSSPATLTHVVLAVADMPGAVQLFEGLLGGRDAELPAEPFPGTAVVDLAWPGPGRLRLLQPARDTPAAIWLGDRPGRLLHLALDVADPDVVTGAVPLGDGRLEVPPEANHGVRLVLRPSR